MNGIIVFIKKILHKFVLDKFVFTALPCVENIYPFLYSSTSVSKQMAIQMYWDDEFG